MSQISIWRRQPKIIIIKETKMWLYNNNNLHSRWSSKIFRLHLLTKCSRHHVEIVVGRNQGHHLAPQRCLTVVNHHALPQVKVVIAINVNKKTLMMSRSTTMVHLMRSQNWNQLCLDCSNQARKSCPVAIKVKIGWILNNQSTLVWPKMVNHLEKLLL